LDEESSDEELENVVISELFGTDALEEEIVNINKISEIDGYSEEIFREHMRLKRATATYLISKYTKCLLVMK